MNFHSKKEYIGKKLLELRKERNENQTEVANAIGISRAALSYYEKGERSIDIDVLFALSQHYEVSIDYLFGLSDERKLARDINQSEELHSIGFSDEVIDSFWNSSEAVELINDMVRHPNWSYFEELTYYSRYTKYEEIDAGYRSFLTSQLLYSMISDIYREWYENDPCRINELSSDEKEKIINDIETYLQEERELDNSQNIEEFVKCKNKLEDNLRSLYFKLERYL